MSKTIEQTHISKSCHIKELFLQKLVKHSSSVYVRSMSQKKEVLEREKQDIDGMDKKIRRQVAKVKVPLTSDRLMIVKPL